MGGDRRAWPSPGKLCVGKSENLAWEKTTNLYLIINGQSPAPCRVSSLDV